MRISRRLSLLLPPLILTSCSLIFGSPAISLSSTSVSFSGTAGGSNPSSQNVTVSNSGGGTLASPTTSITYGSGSGWLTVPRCNCHKTFAFSLTRTTVLSVPKSYRSFSNGMDEPTLTRNGLKPKGCGSGTE